MGIADWLLIAVYVAGVLFIAWLTLRRTQTVSDYFVARRSVPRTAFGFLSSTIAHHSSPPGDSAAAAGPLGVAGIWGQLVWLLTLPFCWIAAPLIRRLRVTNAADFFGLRFGALAAVIYSCYAIVISVVIMAATLYGGSRMTHAVTGRPLDEMADRLSISIPVIGMQRIETNVAEDVEGKTRLAFSKISRNIKGYEYAMLLIAGLSGLYVAAGGLKAVAGHSLVQGALLLLATLLVCPLLFFGEGGFAAFDAASTQGAFQQTVSDDAGKLAQAGTLSFSFLIVFGLTAACGLLAQPQFIMLCASSREEFRGRVELTIGLLVKRLVLIAWAVVSVISIGSWVKSTGTAWPYASEADIAAGRAIHNLLEGWPLLRGLTATAMLSTVIAVVGAQAVAASGMFVESIFRRHIMRGRGEAYYVLVGRFATLALLAAAILLQVVFTDIVDAMQMVVAVPAAIGLNMWAALYWPRWNFWCLVTSTLAAGAAWIAMRYMSADILAETSFMNAMFVNSSGHMMVAPTWQLAGLLIAGTTTGVITAFVTAPPPIQLQDRFYSLLRASVEVDETVRLAGMLPEEKLTDQSMNEFGMLRVNRPDRNELIGLGVITAGVIALLVIAAFVF